MENSINTIGSHTGIFSITTLERFKTLKNSLQKLIIWLLIGGAICGALFILMGSIEGGEVIGKFMGTLFILGGAALVSFINFNKIETKIPSVQVFATIGVVTNVLWMVLWILVLWGVFDIYAHGACTTLRYTNELDCPIIGFSLLGILTITTSYLSSLGFFGALTLGIYEGTKKSTIRPLKLTAISCLTFTELYNIVTLFTQSLDSRSASSSLSGRFGVLAGFAGFVWLNTTLIALILAKHEKNAAEYAEKKEKDEKQQEILALAVANVTAMSQQPTVPKTDEQLRAEIEEKVRREMIEKEVREKVEQEMATPNTSTTTTTAETPTPFENPAPVTPVETSAPVENPALTPEIPSDPNVEPTPPVPQA